MLKQGVSVLAVGIVLSACAANACSEIRLTVSGTIEARSGGDVFCRSGEHGLWRLVFADKSTLSAADFATNAVLGGMFTCRDGQNGVVYAWTSPRADVTVATVPLANGAVDVQAKVVVNDGESVQDLELPARLRFAADQVKRFVYPGHGGFGIGMAFNSGLFTRRLAYRANYPTLFCDFGQLETAGGGRMSVYGLRPRLPHETWKNPRPFTPGWTCVGGDLHGGFYDHAFGVYIRSGETWESPSVRLAPDLSLDAALADYAAGNGIRRTLADKVKDGTLLEKFKRAPLYTVTDIAKFTGTLSSVHELIAAWRQPTLLHFTTYLRGGFDRQYPDHLPPSPKFGSAEELKELIGFAQSKGHLVCPYTNPTWWGDKPRGPTFQKWGEDALARKKDNSFYNEKYYGCEGFVQSYHHPGSLEGNRRTVRQFTEEYPVDLIFQDQTGSRDWIYDFNPASPSPTAQTDGLLSMLEENARQALLASEDGWDGLINTDLAFMGCTWKIVGVDTAPARMKLFKEDFLPADVWEIEAVSTRLAHDKVLFYMHNLGSFVTDDRTMAWMLGLGFNLSVRSRVIAFKLDPAYHEWYKWVHMMQGRVVSRIAGQRVVSFKHDRTPLFARGGDMARRDDDGVITAQYGDVRVAANLGDVPRTVGDKRLAAYGFFVEAPGLCAAKLEGECAFVELEGERYVFAPDASVQPAGPRDAEPPCARVGAKPRLAILDLGAPFVPGHLGGAASVDDWAKGLADSALVRTHGVRVERVTSAAALKEVFAAGHRTYFAILNPYGEIFPVEGRDRWREVVSGVRDYVRAGGVWVETGSASFNAGAYSENGKLVIDHCFLKGMELLGLQYTTFGEVKEAPVPLKVMPSEDALFSARTRDLLARKKGRVNRGAGDCVSQAVRAALLDGQGRTWLGGYRLGGWGTLWRFGGMGVDRDLAISAVCDILLDHYTHVPAPVPAPRVPRLRRDGGTERTK